MKKIIFILILLATLYSCTSNRYLLSDTGNDKTFLAEQIDKLAKEKQISKHPMIVLDGQEYRYDKELKESKLPISKNDIAKIDVVKMDKAKEIYSGGIILITTKSVQNSKE